MVPWKVAANRESVLEWVTYRIFLELLSLLSVYAVVINDYNCSVVALPQCLTVIFTFSFPKI